MNDDKILLSNERNKLRCMNLNKLDLLPQQRQKKGRQRDLSRGHSSFINS